MPKRVTSSESICASQLLLGSANCCQETFQHFSAVSFSNPRIIIYFRYRHHVVGDGIKHHRNNPEVNVNSNVLSSTTRQQLLNLRRATESLMGNKMGEDAYRGLDGKLSMLLMTRFSSCFLCSLKANMVTNFSIFLQKKSL